MKKLISLICFLPTLLLANPIIDFENDAELPILKKLLNDGPGYNSIEFKLLNDFFQTYLYKKKSSNPKNWLDLKKLMESTEKEKYMLFFATIMEIKYSGNIDTGMNRLRNKLNISISNNDLIDSILDGKNQTAKLELLNLVYINHSFHNLLGNSAFKKFSFIIFQKQFPNFSLMSDFYSLFTENASSHDHFSISPRLALSIYETLFNVRSSANEIVPNKIFDDLALNPTENNFKKFIIDFKKNLFRHPYLTEGIEKIKVRSSTNLSDDLRNLVSLYSWNFPLMTNPYILSKLTTKINRYASQEPSDSTFLDYSTISLLGDFFEKNFNSSDPQIKLFISAIQKSLVSTIASNWSDYKYARTYGNTYGLKRVLWLGGVLKSLFPKVSLKNLDEFPFARQVMQEALSSRTVDLPYETLNSAWDILTNVAGNEPEESFFKLAKEFFNDKSMYEHMYKKGLDARITAFFDVGGSQKSFAETTTDNQLQDLLKHFNSNEFRFLPYTHQQAIFFSLPMKLADWIFKQYSNKTLTDSKLNTAITLLERSVEHYKSLPDSDKQNMLYWQRIALATFMEFGTTKFGHSMLGKYYDRYWNAYRVIQASLFQILQQAQKNDIDLFRIRHLADAFFKGDTIQGDHQFADGGHYKTALERLDFIVHFLPSDENNHQLYEDVFKAFLLDLVNYMSEFSRATQNLQVNDLSAMARVRFLSEYIWKSLMILNSYEGKQSFDQFANQINNLPNGQNLQSGRSFNDYFFDTLLSMVNNEKFFEYNLLPVLMVTFPEKIRLLLNQDSFLDLLASKYDPSHFNYEHLDKMLSALIANVALIENKDMQKVRIEILTKIKNSLLPTLFGLPRFNHDGDLSNFATTMIDYFATHCSYHVTD
ncbi:MAG: hypothetical protein QE271_10120 [Bacteriovoracaceae bacterium]|nr:hypothetical protein [Bacteriovoracaceae bacterium]